MLAEYLNLKDQLEYTRWKHAGKNSDEEEALLDEMDAAWLKLSEEERREVNRINYTPSLPRPSGKELA